MTRRKLAWVAYIALFVAMWSFALWAAVTS